jgi:DNA-binding transcriptional LysR family regulator
MARPAKPRKAPLRRRLPPLDYLVAFEASAECVSFAGASKLLNISETAISRKVRLLEQHFGLSFFLRGHRSIELTPHGRAFLSRIRPALELIRDAADDAMRTSQNRPVTLAATNSVAALWLTPRLTAFRRDNPHLKIMLLSSDNDEECLADTVDLTILRGDGKWPGYSAQMLFGETVFPVCAPGFLAETPEAASLDSLPGMPLIEVASSHTEWMTWRDWLASQGHARAQLEHTAFFNTYPLAVQAAVDGAGVALGWGHLVDRLLDEGRLVRPLGPAYLRTAHGYYLLLPEDRVISAGTHEVADWLMQLSASRRRYGSAPPAD